MSAGHPIKDHVHGVIDNRCGHPDCCAASARYFKRWRYDAAHGRYRTVPVERARNHIASLEGAGWSVRAIGEAAGVPASVISRVRLGKQPTITRTIESAILRLDADGMPARMARRGFMPKVGTVRRLQALTALGWSAALLGAHVGERPHWIHNRLHQGGLWVTKDVHDRVVAMYDELSMTLPPQETQREQVAASRARTAARKQGWLPPLALDDDRLDDPTYLPGIEAGDDANDDEPHDYDHAVVERFIASGERVRKLTHAESAEACRRLRALGHTTFDIEHTYGLKPERYKESESA